MSTSIKAKRKLRLQAYLFNLLFLAMIGLLAWFSTQFSFTSDWTYGQRNSLTEASVRLLQSMPDDIQVNVYLPEPSSMKAAIETLLKRYQAEKKNFKFKILNPDLDIELAKAENITRYGQVTVKYHGKRETIESINESLIGNALARLSRSTQPHAVFLQGHGERNPADSSNTGFSKLSAALTEKGFITSGHNLLNGTLPEDTSLLVIAGATGEYLPGEIERIEQYIKSGGNLLWLQDPDTENKLDAIAKQLHIRFIPGILVDADPQLRATLRIQHPAMIAVLQYNLHKITERLPYNTLFMLAGAVDFTPGDNSDWSGTVLFSSRETTWSETGTLLTKEITFNKASGDQLGPLPMAQALERQLTIKGDDNPVQQRIVVVADSDFLANSYIGAGANLLLGQNIFNWLSQNDQLLSFDIKSAPDLTLELNDTMVTIIGLVFLVIIPAGLLLTGLLIWRKRRRG